MEAVRNILLFVACALVLKNAVCETESGSCSRSFSCWETMLDRVKESEYKVKEMEKEIATTRRKIDDLSKGTNIAIVAFSAYDPEELYLSDGDIIKYSQVLLNMGDNYDTSSGVFTAPVTGLYQFSASICNTKGDFIVYNIVKGSEVIAINTQWDDTDSCNSVQAVVMVNAGEGVFVEANYVPAGFALYENVHRRNTFSGVLVHAAS